MSVVKIKVVYDYYSSKRITPFYIDEEEVLSQTFEEFKRHLTKEVPHLGKILSPLRLTVYEGESEVDLSSTYFNLQIKGLLEKEKIITVNAFASNSPAVKNVFSTSTLGNHPDAEMSEVGERTDKTARRSLDLMPESRILLPLERYTKKQKEAVDDLSLELKTKRQELTRLQARVEKARVQNAGCKTVCGSCHLKLGHTKKSCSFSPCKTAFSCGLLAKHNNEKSEITSLEREITRIENKMLTASNELETTKRAAQKVVNSVPKRIEDTIIQELPDRYMFNGLRNWALLNKDVAVIQKHLQGQLPSRESVNKLLYEVVIKGVKSKSSSTSTQAVTDHRMSSQKRILSDEYGIQFPMSEKKSAFQSSTCNLPGHSSQENMDFRLALKLQQEEMTDVEPSCSYNDPNFLAVETASTPIHVNSHDKEDIEVEADAAAALLALKRR